MNNVAITLNGSLKGFYRAVLNEGTDDERDTGWFPNLITTQGLDRLGQAGAAPNILAWGSIGTGTDAPSFSDSSLQAVTASHAAVTSSQSNIGGPTYAGEVIVSTTYAQGAVVGNMAEVGMGWTTGGVDLFSRARILDGGGLPTTLPVTAIDQLTVYYKLVCTPDITDSSGTAVIGGVSYGVTGRLAHAAIFMSNMTAVFNGTWGQLRPLACNAYAAGSTLGAITAAPSGVAVSLAGATVASPGYTIGTFYRDSTITCGPLDGNAAGGVQGLLVGFSASGQADFQYVLDAPIPKDNTKELTLTFRFSWARA